MRILIYIVGSLIIGIVGFLLSRDILEKRNITTKMKNVISIIIGIVLIILCHIFLSLNEDASGKVDESNTISIEERCENEYIAYSTVRVTAMVCDLTEEEILEKFITYAEEGYDFGYGLSLLCPDLTEDQIITLVEMSDLLEEKNE